MRDDEHSIVVRMIPVLGGKHMSGAMLHHAEFDFGHGGVLIDLNYRLPHGANPN